MTAQQANSRRGPARRSIMAGALAIALTAPLMAGALGVGGPVTGVLGHASDNALDKLSQPGAFYGDSAIRIGVPGLGGGAASSLMGLGDKAGLTGGLTHSINDAAGMAAQDAKPIFRKAIDSMSISDAPGIISKSDGGTQYLRRTAGDELRAKVRPLIVLALEKVGAFRQLDKLGAGGGMLSGVGLSHDGLSNSVTDQALNGIYTYMGREEGNLRSNPMGKAGGMLGGLIKH